MTTNQLETHVTNQAPLSPEKLDQAAHSADRREAERHPCTVQPLLHIAGASQAESTKAAIRDISATGIGFSIQQPVKSGTVLILMLQSLDQRFRRPMPARVMHTTLRAEGDWLVGCRFVRGLSAHDLRILLGED